MGKLLLRLFQPQCFLDDGLLVFTALRPPSPSMLVVVLRIASLNFFLPFRLFLFLLLFFFFFLSLSLFFFRLSFGLFLFDAFSVLLCFFFSVLLFPSLLFDAVLFHLSLELSFVFILLIATKAVPSVFDQFVDTLFAFDLILIQDFSSEFKVGVSWALRSVFFSFL